VRIPFLKPVIPAVFLALGLLFLVVSTWVLISVSGLPDVRFLADPGLSFKITVRGWQGEARLFTVGPRNPSWTPLEAVPESFRKAVMAGEDFSFYSHNGVDWFEVREAIRKDLKEGRFARGASTITQQLAKNLFLSRKKTLKRKLQELVLTRRLEKALIKDRILELYLNVVELGDMIYGVRQGSRRHFGKEPSKMSLRESAFLAAMLPGPRVYDPDRHMDRVMNRADHLLSVMLRGQMITEEEYLLALNEIPHLAGTPIPEDTREDSPPEDGEGSPRAEAGEEVTPVLYGWEKEPEPVPIYNIGETMQEETLDNTPGVNATQDTSFHHASGGTPDRHLDLAPDGTPDRPREME
jgi:monofunctional biosynthetic peptidoglycan transglycosylase